MSIATPGELCINGATFVRNMAASGGAISVVSTTTKVSGLDYNLTHCTFQSNNASDGGALYLFNSARDVNVKHSIFRGNYAGESEPYRTKTLSQSVLHTLYARYVIHFVTYCHF